ANGGRGLFHDGQGGQRGPAADARPPRAGAVAGRSQGGAAPAAGLRNGGRLGERRDGPRVSRLRANRRAPDRSPPGRRNAKIRPASPDADPRTDRRNRGDAVSVSCRWTHGSISAPAAARYNAAYPLFRILLF